MKFEFGRDTRVRGRSTTSKIGGTKDQKLQCFIWTRGNIDLSRGGKEKKNSVVDGVYMGGPLTTGPG